MKILNVSGTPPNTVGDGSSASLATVAAMCAAGNVITYAYPEVRLTDEDRQRLEQFQSRCGANLRLLPIGVGSVADNLAQKVSIARFASRGLLNQIRFARKRLDQATRNGIFRLTFLERCFYSHMRKPLRRLIDNEDFDVLQVDYPWMMGIVSAASSKLPTAFVAHEVQRDVVAQMLPALPDLVAAVERLENRRLNEFTAILTLSEEDRAAIEARVAPKPVFCSPLTIDFPDAPDASPARFERTAPVFTFVGGQRHPPNADAVQWLVRDIVPALRERLTSFRVKIIGAYAPAFVREHSAPEVEFTGFATDLTEQIAGTIFLCPIRIASGMRIKILDAIVRGAPVISTVIGARGLAIEPDRHFLSADSPAEFAWQVNRLLQDAALRERLVTEARARLEATYSPAVVARRRTDALESIVNSWKSARR